MIKNKFIKRIASSLVALGISTIAYSNSWAENLKIGVAGPYTGEMSNYGISAKNGVTLAIKHINAAGGVLGTDLEAVSQDDACDSVKAARVAENMIAENVIAVIGHICNNSTEAALPSYVSANIPVISAASTNPNLTNEGRYPNFFRTISHDASQAQLQVEFAVKALGIKKAAVIFDQGNYGKEMAGLVRDGLEQNGVKVLVFEPIESGAENYSELIGKLRKAKVNSSNGTAVFFSGYHPEAAKFVAEARKERNNAYFISGDGVKDPSFIENAGKYAMEYYVSAPFDLSKVASARSVTEQYKAEFGSEPTIHSLRSYAAVQVFAKALEKSGTSDSSAVIETLKEVEMQDSAIGEFSFSESGDILGAGDALYQVRPTPTGLRFVPAY